MIRRLLLAFVVVIVVGGVAFRLWRGPSPEAILAGIDVPASPVLSPEAERATFRVAEGFRVELVAAEPLIVDPVAIDWDDAGRLYVVEMRGFMPDIDGAGEDRPVGRIVILEDTDGDGAMDRSDVFLDELVLPRAVAVLPEGVLVGVPPDLWLCRDTTGDRACDERTRLTEYAMLGPNPEHQENGLLAGLDGWIYNAKSTRRFRLSGDSIEIDETPFRGQWGIAQDDAGRLFYNHNSAFLYGDTIPAEYPMRQPSTATSLPIHGVNVPLSDGAEVFGIRVTPGLNRAYLSGTLRPNGRQLAPTAVSGLAIQRGHQFGPEWVGDAFVPESGGAAVAHWAVEREGTELRGEHRLYADETFGSREFLASSDERFRPVDAEHGPDGAIWIVDMYRGVIQHARYVSEHLRAYALEHDLEAPGETGRIWRIVRDDRPIERRPPRLDALSEQLRALDHPNGWVRDHAQRRIVYEASAQAAPALRQLGEFGSLGRRHALWALGQMGALDEATWRRALADADPETRIVGLRAGEALISNPDRDSIGLVVALLDDPDPAVRLQALHTLGSLPPEARPIRVLLERGRGGEPIVRQASISGLAGFELAALRAEIERGGRAGKGDPSREWLAALTSAAFLAAREGDDPMADVARVLDLASALESEQLRVAVLEGIEAAQRSPGSRRVELATAHPVFDPIPAASGEGAAVLRRIRRHFTWPGDPRPGGARALSSEENARRERGRTLFAVTCATCHGVEGRGLAGLAPSLVGTTWVRDADEWLVRIALDGLTGPIRIDGHEWNLNMPGHGHDPRFDDDGLAGVLTHMRRSWGHAEDPIAPETVSKIRAERAGRVLPWTAKELRALPIAHRLDRFVGIYGVPMVSIELAVRREGSLLMVGRRDGGAAPIEEAGEGLFIGPELTVQFEADESGVIEGASVVREGTTFPVTKKE